MARRGGLPLSMVWVASIAACYASRSRVELYKGWNVALFLEPPRAMVTATVVPEIGGAECRLDGLQKDVIGGFMLGIRRMTG